MDLMLTCGNELSVRLKQLERISRISFLQVDTQKCRIYVLQHGLFEIRGS